MNTQKPQPPSIVGYMPDSPDGDPLITLESHEKYVEELLAHLKASSIPVPPVGCRYRKTDNPERQWTYREGVAVTPWNGWEVEPLYTKPPRVSK